MTVIATSRHLAMPELFQQRQEQVICGLLGGGGLEV
jgi:hypothetical protein